MESAESLPKVYQLLDRVLIVEKNKHTKRQPAEHEYFRRSNGGVVHPWWTRERIQNEAAAIKFVAAHTTIPVPEHQLYERDGLLHLDKYRIPGVMLSEINEKDMPAAVEAVAKQLEEDVLPQLRSLRRGFIGCVDRSLPVMPPPRIYRRDRRTWERITSEHDEFAFVFCHNDLSQRNILVDPDTFQITRIIDWEFAGYFPPEWELAIWRCETLDGPGVVSLEVWERDLALFGLQPEHIRDCANKQPPLPPGRN